MTLKERYELLYNDMATSGDTKKMMLFGSVMNEMMERAIKNDASFAEQEIEKLEAMNWKQYLTAKEAEDVCLSMKPSYKWPFNTWENALKSFKLEIEREPYFNKYALWATMNSKYSDHAETISEKILETKLEDASAEQLVGVIHALAVDSLLDKDEKFNVRKYFLN
jgi:anion-transporting  ArsA/GET3 family ATPase